MRANAGFVLTFTGMMIAIAILSGTVGCTQFDKSDSDKRDIEILVTPVPDGGCIVQVGSAVTKGHEDTSTELIHPPGG